VAMKVFAVIFALCALQSSLSANADDDIHLPVSAPISSDSAGRGSDVALQSVVRVLCLPQGTQGTGFFAQERQNHHGGSRRQGLSRPSYCFIGQSEAERYA